MKCCVVCKQIKEDSDFDIRKRNLDCLDTICKSCRKKQLREYQRQYHKEHPNYLKEYYQKNKDKIKQYHKDRYKSESIKEYYKEYYIKKKQLKQEQQNLKEEVK